MTDEEKTVKDGDIFCSLFGFKRDFFGELVGVNVYVYGDPSPAAQNDAYGGKAFP